MKSLFSSVFLGVIAGTLAFFLHPSLHKNFSTTPLNSLDFYPPEIREFLNSGTSDAAKFRAESTEADDKIVAAHANFLNRRKLGASAENEQRTAAVAYLQAGIEKLEHVFRVADAYERAAIAPPDSAISQTSTSEISLTSLVLNSSRNFAIAIGFIAFLLALFFCAIIHFLKAVVSFFSGSTNSENVPPSNTQSVPNSEPPPKKSPDAASFKEFRLQLASGVFLEMLPVRAGSFLREDGKRSISVPIRHPFWLGKYEVTQAQWKAIMGNNSNPSKHRGDSRPVENISFAEVAEFCKKINESEAAANRLPKGYSYALPTEDEWSYAASAGGNSSTDSIGWSARNSGGQTHNVGELPPNAWGFFDMAGNVSEMCADIAVGNLSPGSKVRSMRDRQRIILGGDITKHETSAISRDALEEDAAASEVGFRLALRKNA